MLDNDIDIVLEASVMQDIAEARPGIGHGGNGDIEEQETGVELVSKLPRIVLIANYTQGVASSKGELYSTAFLLLRGMTFDSTLSLGFH